MSDTFNRAIRLFFSTDSNPLEHPLEWDDAFEFDGDWKYPK